MQLLSASTVRKAISLVAAVLLSASVCSAQIKVGTAQAARASETSSADSLIPTSVELDLCVDGGTPQCPPNPNDFRAYVPFITLTYGQTLDGVVRVTGASFGTLTLFNNGVLFCTLEVDANQSCTQKSTLFDIGIHTVTADFQADTTYADSTALPVVVTVLPESTSLTLKSSAPISPFGSPVTFTAQALGFYQAVPVGQIVLGIDGVALPASAVDPTGSVSYTTSSLAIGTHSITASYAGSLDFLGADEVSITQLIQPPATMTSLVSSLDPSTFGEGVTFTASVAAATGSAGTPSGAVTFKDGTTAFATVLANSKAVPAIWQTTISTLNQGSHSITAIYSGDSATSPSVSPVLIQQVNAPLIPAQSGYTITVTPSPVTLGTGQTADLTVTVTPLGGLSAPVTLACSDLPNESACTFGQSTIPAGGGSTTLAFSTMSPHDCGANPPYYIGRSTHTPSGRPGRYAGPVFAGFLLLLLRRRRWKTTAVSLMAVCAVSFLSGCGTHCTDFGTQPGNYTFKINGTIPATPVVAGQTPSNAGAVTVSVALTVKL